MPTQNTNDAKEDTKSDGARVGTEKLLSFHVYERRYPRGPADKAWCVAAVHEGGRGVGFHQCGRRPKFEYGGHGWCSQHYPPNEEKRRQERNAIWQAERVARQAKWDAEQADKRLKDAALDALKRIADGHNDPRGLAIEVLGRTQDPT